MKTIEMLKNEYTYITLVEAIEDMLEMMWKENGRWNKWTPALFALVMEDIATEWDTNAEALKEYFLNDADYEVKEYYLGKM